MPNAVEKLQELLLPVLETEGAELVELQLKGKHGSQIVKVFVDTEQGITLQQCESISRQFADILDIEDIISGKYRLEVSSPGINRPLRSSKDFSRNMHRQVKVYYEHEAKRLNFVGEIVDVSEEAVTLKGKKEIKQIELSKINHGQIDLPW